MNTKLALRARTQVLIEAGEEGANVKEYSFFDIASVIVGQAFELDHMRDYIGLLSLTVIFSFASIVVPVIQSLILVVIYWKSFSLVGLKRMLTLHEIFAAWQWFEVFLVSAVVALQEKELLIQPNLHIPQTCGSQYVERR